MDITIPLIVTLKRTIKPPIKLKILGVSFMKINTQSGLRRGSKIGTNTASIGVTFGIARAYKR